MNSRWLAWLVLAALSSSAHTAPGDTIYAEGFQDGNANGWSQAGGNGTLAIGEYAPGSGEYALTTCCGDVVAISPAIDTGFAGAQLALRIQRGGIAIDSEAPGNNADLDLYFLDVNGDWQFMARYSGGSTAAQTINDSFTLTGALLHPAFRVRLEQRGGGANADYWHLHEINIIEAGASGSIGSLCDDFASGLAHWTVNSFGGTAAVTTQTFQSAFRSLAIFGGSSRLHSLPLDLADANGATLNLWVRRGDDGFSEDPDGGEDLVIGYLDAGGNHQELRVLAGDGAPGETFNLSFALPPEAFHDAFQVRIERYGDGADGYWHIDDVCVDIERTLDHFAIGHDGSGVNCQAEPVEIVAHDVNHFVVENYAGGLGLSTSTGNGDWSVAAGAGVLANSGSGNGSYTFAVADNGAAILGLRDTFDETVNIDVSNGAEAEVPLEDGDLVFNASGFNVLVNGSAAPVPTQVAGKPSDVAPDATAVELQAIRTNDITSACEAAFTGSVNVELAFSCEDPASCTGPKLTVNGNAVAANPAGSPSAFTSLSLDFGDAADSTAPLVLQYNDAGRVRVHARHVLQPSGTIMAGSSNAFVVRPFGFAVSASGNPGATDDDGTVYRKAGEPFSVTVRAVGWQASDDTNADGMPDGYGNADPADNADVSDNMPLANFGNENAPDTVSLTANLALPVGGTNPGLSGNTALTDFANGAASTISRFSEAGILELVANLADSDYLGTGDITSRSGFTGRFTPDHFDVVIVSHGCNDTAGFSYSGQPFRNLTITARNTFGGTVQNFDGPSGFSRIVMLSEVSGLAGSVVNDGVSAMDFIDGVATLLDAPAGVSFRFANPETAPASIMLRATDEDGVSSRDHAEGQTEVRSGRFVVDDESAPVLADAISALRVESFDGLEWHHEAEDSCTVLDVALLGLDDHAGNLAIGESVIGNAVFDNGIGQVTLTAPGSDNDGSMRLHYDADDWLEYDWSGSGVGDPLGVIRFFGIFSTEPGLIQRYEVVP